MLLVLVSSIMQIHTVSSCGQGGANNHFSQSDSERFGWKKVGLQLLQYGDSEYIPTVRRSTSQCNPQAGDCTKQAALQPTNDVPAQTSPTVQDECADVAPENASLECVQYAEKGLCSNLPEAICMKSCDTCCTDKFLEGISDCQTIIDLELCMDADMIQQNICDKSCNRCQGQTSVSSIIQPPSVPIQAAPSPVEIPPQQGLRGVDGSEVAMFALNEAIINPPQNWGDIVQMCEWEGVSCKGSAVVGIELFQFGLQGTLPPELSAITQMEIAIFSANFLEGTLPKEYSTWKNVARIAFGDNRLSGTLPAEYSEWERMQNVHLTLNQFTGTLPVEFSTWGELQEFRVFDNQLSGTLPIEYSTWRDLITAKFERNRLSGDIPVEYSTWQSLDLLYIGSGNERLCIPRGLRLSAPTNDLEELQAC